MIEYLYGGMLVISVILIYFGIRHYNVTKNLLTDGIKTKAKVIDLIKITGDDGYTYKPVFEYKDKANNIVTFKSDVSSSPAPYDIGDTVNMVYAKNSDEKKIISFWGLYRWTIILLSIASPLLIIGGGYILYSRG
ncbi:DUF3592 domain-containing protein [uncultured Aquimarina sp.]|uniref:DUF3592 domain-containing protein n=1 Tax=uncultured Aquimarina sp. TaxID=575652 RepID=UPI00261986F9|nr:DUF3592 domain-containing protein [uncultured Aquimarina sp.]